VESLDGDGCVCSVEIGRYRTVTVLLRLMHCCVLMQQVPMKETFRVLYSVVSYLREKARWRRAESCFCVQSVDGVCAALQCGAMLWEQRR
jgi:hypothetical protein